MIQASKIPNMRFLMYENKALLQKASLHEKCCFFVHKALLQKALSPKYFSLFHPSLGVFLQPHVAYCIEP